MNDSKAIAIELVTQLENRYPCYRSPPKNKSKRKFTDYFITGDTFEIVVCADLRHVIVQHYDGYTLSQVLAVPFGDPNLFLKVIGKILQYEHASRCQRQFLE